MPVHIIPLIFFGHGLLTTICMFSMNMLQFICSYPLQIIGSSILSRFCSFWQCCHEHSCIYLLETYARTYTHLWVECLSLMEINEDQSKKMGKGYLFRIPVAKGPPTVTVLWQRLEGKQRSGKVLWWKKGRIHVDPDWRLLFYGSWRWLTRSGMSYVMD